MRYQAVIDLSTEFSISSCCRVLGISRVGFYAWKRRPLCNRKKYDVELLENIKSIHKESRKTYGSPRILEDLRSLGLACGKHRVVKIMRENNIFSCLKKRFVRTTNSEHDLKIAENILNQKFEVFTWNTHWCADFTYVYTHEGWLYLAVVLDLYNREIVGWSMDSRMTSSLVKNALVNAIEINRPLPGLICHSDRGSQYASHLYQDTLEEYGFTCSMSRKGNCYDNAVVESFFATLKKELVNTSRFTSRKQAQSEIFRWIEGWYNTKRSHSALGFKSPDQFNKESLIAA